MYPFSIYEQSISDMPIRAKLDLTHWTKRYDLLRHDPTDDWLKFGDRNAATPMRHSTRSSITVIQRHDSAIGPGLIRLQIDRAEHILWIKEPGHRQWHRELEVN